MNIAQQPDFVLSGLGRLQRIADTVESVVLDLLAATTPWLAPLFPAYIAFTHISAVLLMPVWLALIGGVVIEALGLTTIHTTFQFWAYNEAEVRSQDTGDRMRAPVVASAFSGAFYLLIVVTVNILLDDSPMLHRFAKALLSLISVVAAITLALRSQHKRRLLDAAAAVAQEKAEADEKERARRELAEQERLARRDERQANKRLKAELELSRERLEIERLKVSAEVAATQAKVSETFHELSESSSKFPRTARKLLPEHYALLRNMSEDEVIAQAQVDAKTARVWLARAAEYFAKLEVKNGE